MHALLSQWHDAHLAIKTIEDQLKDTIKSQMVLESAAYREVYGKLIPVYETIWNYSKINEDGRMEAWRYGSWGGADDMVWERDIEDAASDEELKKIFIERFVLQKGYQDAEAARTKEAKRKSLLTQLEELDSIK